MDSTYNGRSVYETFLVPCTYFYRKQKIIKTQCFIIVRLTYMYMYSVVRTYEKLNVYKMTITWIPCTCTENEDN